MLDVGDGQRIYWEEWGSPEGVPAVYLHGGPGGGLGQSSYRNRFDLAVMRVVSFEQRGCGRSTPHASDPSTSLAFNTTPHLVADMEALREHLDIEAWVVNGASWGSTLGFAYATAHPERVLGLVAFAVTTTSRREIDWVTEGVGAIYPEAWDRFAAFAEKNRSGFKRGASRLVDAYAQLMNHQSDDVRDRASLEWAAWEDAHVSIATGGVQRDPRWDDYRFRHAFTRLTTHYWSNDGFCDPPILERVHALRRTPGFLIHGRRDVSSPAVTPWELHREWPTSSLCISDEDGHGGSSMADRWREANDSLANSYR